MNKCAPTTSKNELWKEWKILKDKKKKQVASNSDRDTFEEGLVHRTRIVAIVSTENWASVTSSDDDNEILPSLRSTSLTKKECLFV